MAMERLKSCESVTALSEEPGIHRTLLYNGVIKWKPSKAKTAHPPIPANENSAPKFANSSACWRTRRWRRIFSKVPCKKSRLDARAKMSLAGRRFRPNPGVDADARQF